MAQDRIIRESLVIPDEVLASRLWRGDGVRKTDVPVSEKVFNMMRDVGNEVAAADVISRLRAAGTDPIRVTRGAGPKAYPLNMHLDLAKPERTPARREHVANILTDMLYFGIAGEGNYFSQKAGNPRTYVASLGSLAKNRIALRPYGEGDPFVQWIEQDVVEKLRTRITGAPKKSIPEFTSLKVTKYTEDCLEITMV